MLSRRGPAVGPNAALRSGAAVSILVLIVALQLMIPGGTSGPIASLIHLSPSGFTGAGSSPGLPPPPPSTSLIPINITTGFTRASPPSGLGSTSGVQEYAVYTGSQIFQTLNASDGLQRMLPYNWDGDLDGTVSAGSSALIFGSSYLPGGGTPILEEYTPSTGGFLDYAPALPAAWQPFGSGVSLTSGAVSAGTIAIAEENGSGIGNNVTLLTGTVVPQVCSLADLFGATIPPTILGGTEGIFLVAGLVGRPGGSTIRSLFRDSYRPCSVAYQRLALDLSDPLPQRGGGIEWRLFPVERLPKNPLRDPAAISV